MKTHTWIILSAACLMAAGNLNLKAEEGKKHSPEDRKEKKQEQFNEMSTRLGLTADQQAIIKTQRESTMPQIKAIREDDSLTREQKREKMKALKQSNQDSMSAYLTDDQKKIMEEIKAEREKKRAEMKGKGGKKSKDKAQGDKKDQPADAR
jgi:hypothetical protein